MMSHKFDPVHQGEIELTCLIETVHEVGDAIMAARKKNISVRRKADNSPVTDADEYADHVLFSCLQAHYPHIQVISEENTQSHSHRPQDIYFLVDPIDGTRDFINPNSRGHFTINIGLIMNRRAVGGIIYAPMLDWLSWASLETGAFQCKAGTLSRLSLTQDNIKDRIAVTSHFHGNPKEDAFLQKNNITKTFHVSSSLKFMYMASGQALFYPKFSPTMEWDTAAGEAILSAAGGYVIDPFKRYHHYGKAGWRNSHFIACGAVSMEDIVT